MLRDATEDFGDNLKTLLSRVGVVHESTEKKSAFQLMKFDRLSPDTFLWLLRDTETFVVSICDGGSSHAGKEFIADKWLGGKVAVEHIETLLDDDGNMYLEDDFDTIVIYRLPANFDLDMDELYDEA